MMKKEKHYNKIRNGLLPFVYKYPYNHHTPIPDDLLKIILEKVANLSTK